MAVAESWMIHWPFSVNGGRLCVREVELVSDFGARNESRGYLKGIRPGES